MPSHVVARGTPRPAQPVDHDAKLLRRSRLRDCNTPETIPNHLDDVSWPTRPQMTVAIGPHRDDIPCGQVIHAVINDPAPGLVTSHRAPTANPCPSTLVRIDSKLNRLHEWDAGHGEEGAVKRPNRSLRSIPEATILRESQRCDVKVRDTCSVIQNPQRVVTPEVNRFGDCPMDEEHPDHDPCNVPCGPHANPLNPARSAAWLHPMAEALATKSICLHSRPTNQTRIRAP